MKSLADTNIFLEILLNRAKKDTCKRFLDENIGDLAISDFSLHSIGVILFRYNKKNLFSSFIRDVMPQVEILSLPIEAYDTIIENSKRLNLDFDDAYQYSTTEYHGLRLVTMDRDFQKDDNKRVLFL